MMSVVWQEAYSHIKEFDALNGCFYIFSMFLTRPEGTDWFAGLLLEQSGTKRSKMCENQETRVENHRKQSETDPPSEAAAPFDPAYPSPLAPTLLSLISNLDSLEIGNVISVLSVSSACISSV